MRIQLEIGKIPGKRKSQMNQITQQKQITWSETINHTLKDKSLGLHINANIYELHANLKCEMALLTVTFDPNIVKTAVEGWERINKLEIDIIEYLGRQEDVVYAISTVEMHPEKKEKKKEEQPVNVNMDETQKMLMAMMKKMEGNKRNGNGEEENEDTVATRGIEVLPKTKEDVEWIFGNLDVGLQYKPVTRRYQIKERVLAYLGQVVPIYKQHMDTLMAQNLAMADTGGVDLDLPMYELTAKMITSSKGAKLDARLDKYPHVHIGIGLTTKTGIMRDIRTIFRDVLEISYAHDVDIRRGNERYKNKSKRGRTADVSNDSKIIGYILKNARHSETAMSLRRCPTRLYNIRGNQMVRDLYLKFYMKTPLIYEEVNIMLIPEVKAQTELVITESKEQTNLPHEMIVTDKAVAKTKLSQMVEMVEAYLQANQMAITPRGTIYQRIKDSAKSWKYWGMPEDLYRKIVNKNNMEIMSATRADYREYTSGGYNNILPYVDLDFMWIEYGDFFMHLPTGGIIKKNEEASKFEYECFSYFPEIKYGEIEGLVVAPPDLWGHILKNSGYIHDNILTETGKELVKDLYGITLPKEHKSKCVALFGEKNAGKTSIISVIIMLYPEDVVETITKAGGHELANLEGKQILYLDEYEGDLGRGTTLKVTEGKVPMAINPKHKNLKTIKPEAKVVISMNEIGEWAYKDGKKKDATILTIEDKEINIGGMDEAIMARISFYEMKTMPYDPYASMKREMMLESEKGKIVLYMAKVKYGEHAFRVFKNEEEIRIYVEHCREQARREEMRKIIAGNV